MAKETCNIDSNSQIVIRDEEKKRREKIPKRATKINVGLMVFALACAIITGTSFDMNVESQILLPVVPISLVIALRNPLVARFAFQVNQQILQESKNQRRQKEIKDALKKRAERQEAREQIDLQEIQVQPVFSIEISEEVNKMRYLERYVVSKIADT